MNTNPKIQYKYKIYNINIKYKISNIATFRTPYEIDFPRSRHITFRMYYLKNNIKIWHLFVTNHGSYIHH